MKYIYVAVFVFVFIVFDLELGYTKDSPLYTHFTFMFQHAGIVHLVINSLAFIGVFRAMERFINKWTLSAVIVFSSFAASIISMYDIPTVGASGMIYTMIGMFFGLIISGETAIIDKKKFSIFVLSVFLSLTISFLKENSNFLLHIYCMLFGFLSSQMVKLK